MKRFVSLPFFKPFFFASLMAFSILFFSTAHAQNSRRIKSGVVVAPTETIVAPVGSSFQPDPSSQAQIKANYDAYMNPTVAPAPIDPAAIAAQQAALAAAAQQKSQEQAAMLQGIGQLCSSLLGGGNTVSRAQQTANDGNTIAAAAWDAQGNHYAEGTNEKSYAAMGKAGEGKFGYEKGCDKFFDKEGKLGSWGATVLEGVRRHPESFSDKVPGDIPSLCPKYASFDKEKREQFWVWTMMALASSESSCNPRDITDDNYGLFQLNSPTCPKASNLFDPIQNTTCAVDRLAKELSRRDNLMSAVSNSPNYRLNTYWGPLRCDDNNSGRGDDVVGALKTRCLMTQYPDCGNKPRGCQFPSKAATRAGLADLKRSCSR